MSTAEHIAEPELPPPPERPDCCNGGCAVCVLEGYPEEVQRWEQEVAAIKARYLPAQTALRPEQAGDQPTVASATFQREPPPR